MAIVSCEHHSGMGLCPECSKEMESFSRNTSADIQRERELQEAITIAERYNCTAAVHYLREALRKTR